MSRVTRPGYAFNQEITLPTATGVSALSINAPFNGCTVQRIIGTVKTTGVGTGTYDAIVLRGETTETVLASLVTTAVSATAVVDTEVFNISGNGNRVDEVDLELSSTIGGTVSTGLTLSLTIIFF